MLVSVGNNSQEMKRKRSASQDDDNKTLPFSNASQIRPAEAPYVKPLVPFMCSVYLFPRRTTERRHESITPSQEKRGQDINNEMQPSIRVLNSITALSTDRTKSILDSVLGLAIDQPRCVDDQNNTGNRDECP